MDESAARFPAFDEWVRAIAKASSHSFARDAESMISSCIERSYDLPDEYGWRYSDEKTIANLVEAARSPAEVNRIYWSDQLRNLEAYAIMSYWRAVELLESTIRSLNWGELVAAATVGRSYLELAASFVTNANTIDGILAEVSFPSNACVVSQDLESFVCKMIWGTRLGDPESHLKQKNILTVIQHVAKNPNASELLPVYECLCELAHPNLIGNARFWSRVECKNSDGSETRILRKQNRDSIAPDIVEHILWSLGWSSVCVRNSFDLTQHGVLSVMARLSEAYPP